MPDLALGDRPAGQHRGDQRNVEPGDVVGDDEFTAGDRGRPVTPDRDAYAEGPYDRARPPLGQPGTRTGPEQADRGEARDPEQDQPASGQQPQCGGQRGAHRPGVPGAVLRGARGGGQPHAHRSGARERKWRR